MAIRIVSAFLSAGKVTLSAFVVNPLSWVTILLISAIGYGCVNKTPWQSIGDNYYLSSTKSMIAIDSYPMTSLFRKEGNKYIDIARGLSGKRGFTATVYGQNVVYVFRDSSKDCDMLMVYSRKTGYHVLCESIALIAEIEADDLGVKCYTPGTTTNSYFTADKISSL